METTTVANGQLLEILPKDSNIGRGKVMRKRRMLLGSSEACDLRFDASTIDAIHAVMEIAGNIGKIYDMNSRSGVFVNGRKVSVSEFRVGDSMQIGGFEFEIKIFDKSDILPPPLQMLQGHVVEDRPKIVQSQGFPVGREATAGHGVPPGSGVQGGQSPELPTVMPDVVTEETFVPRVEYPLAKDPNAEFSEYIFEDVESLYPIFKYKPGWQSVEVIILFDGQIYSVDYVPANEGNYRLVGYAPANREVEYAALGKNEKMDFISVQGGEIFVTPLSGYKARSIENDDLSDQSSIHLLEDDIVSFERDPVRIFVRKTERPPETKRAPIFRRDEGFKKYLALIFVFVSLFLGGISLFEVDPELEKEKAPERIATILYNKKKRVKIKVPKEKPPKVTKEKPPAKTKNAPKKVAQKSPNQKVVKKKPPPVKKPPKKVALKAGRKSPKRGQVRKARPKPGPKNNIKKVTASRKPSPKKGSAPAKRSGPRRKSPTPSKAQGNVDTYKSFDFKSTVSNLMAKGGGTQGIKASTLSSSVGSAGVVGSSASAQSEVATVSNKVGSLSGVASGKLDSASGAEGLSSKRGIFTAGLPSDTVVLGGMDPDTIRRILLDHVPQFRGCYQSALDRSSSQFSGVGKFNFLIGSSGYVTRAGVDTASGVPGSVKQCVVKILRGIKFPSPQGGGVVEVNQPFNFLTRRR